jgi:hypothetical protein
MLAATAGCDGCGILLPLVLVPFVLLVAAPLLLLLLLLLFLLSVAGSLAGTTTGELALDSSPAGTSSLLAAVQVRLPWLQLLCRWHGLGMRAALL